MKAELTDKRELILVPETDKEMVELGKWWYEYAGLIKREFPENALINIHDVVYPYNPVIEENF